MVGKPRHRWFSFKLRTIFILVTLFSVWLGRETWVVRERLATRKWLDEIGGRAHLTTKPQMYASVLVLEPVNTLPFWRRWLGDESLEFVSLPLHGDTERISRLFPEAKIVNLAPP
jgi:hypothetical protein